MELIPLLECLRHTAETAGAKVERRDLSDEELNTTSGFCKLPDGYLVLIDKTATLEFEAEILARFIKSIGTDEMYLAPAVREFIEKQV